MLRRKLIPIVGLCVIALTRVTTAAVHAIPPSPVAPAPAAQDDPLPELRGSALLEYVLHANPYTTWGTWPTDARNPADYSGYLPAEPPHGTAVRVFVNDTVRDALRAPDFSGELPDGSMIVMENYAVTPQSPAALAALTVKIKSSGFYPSGGDWFWLKAAPDGSMINAEGAVKDCIGCHADSVSDFVMSFAFAGDSVAAAGPMGPDLVALHCTTCHTRAVVDSKAWDRAQWSTFLSSHAATLDVATKSAVLDYLTALPIGDVTAVSPAGATSSGPIPPHSIEGITDCSTCHATPPGSPGSPSVGLSTGAGGATDLVAQYCTACHSRSVVDALSGDFAQWDAIVTNHAGFGLRLDSSTRSALIDYLVARPATGSAGSVAAQTCTSCHTPHPTGGVTTCTSCHTPHPLGGPEGDDDHDDHDDDHWDDDDDDDREDDD